MNYRANGNLGCFVIILVLLLSISMLTFFGKIIFTTPVGLVLLAYIVYIWYKKKNSIEAHEQEDIADHFSDDDNEGINMAQRNNAK